MKERPIIFSAPMVRAILEGWKTQTRRIVKPQPKMRYGVLFDDGDPTGLSPGLYAHCCPYGNPGDRLWVREDWQARKKFNSQKPSEIPQDAGIEYLADLFVDGDARKRPARFMPRWASRILLEVTGVRVERLHDISEEDAIAEGVERVVIGEGWRRYCEPDMEEAGVPPVQTARQSYFTLWNILHGHGSWTDNPWVWVVEFRRVP